MKLILGNRAMRKYLLIAITAFFSFLLFFKINQPTCIIDSHTEYLAAQHLRQTSLSYNLMEASVNSDQIYNSNLPLIFIGGMPRSGTTLLRVLLDAHPHIRCGEETRLIPRVLAFRQQWINSPIEARRLREAGITDSVLNSAVSSFILNIIVKHGKPAARLCNKDPFTLRSASYLHEIFPNSKFIFMIRDGRAVVHSIISRQVTISGFDLTDFHQCMKRWNSAMKSMNSQCETLGPNVCLPIHYEQLVLEPEKTLRRVLSFLHVPWNETVLNHEKLINQPGEISLSKLEKSTDQVIKPINIEALGKWKGKIPEFVEKNLDEIAPMLRILGYDPNAGPEQYGIPDELVRKKEEELKKNAESYVLKVQEIKKEREKITNSIKKAKKSKNSKNKDNPPASTNNQVAGYPDSSQQNGQFDTKNKDPLDNNLSASLNYNLVDAVNSDELKNLRKVKRLAYGYNNFIKVSKNQNNLSYQDKQNFDNNISETLFSSNKKKLANSNLQAPPITTKYYQDKKRKLLQFTKL